MFEIFGGILLPRKIDQSISGLIEILNRKGFITLASCLGLKLDHDVKDMNSGYISFDLEKSGQKLNVLLKILDSLEWTLVEKILQFL